MRRERQSGFLVTDPPGESSLSGRSDGNMGRSAEREPALDRIESRSPAEVGKRCTSGTSRLAAAGQGWRLVPAAAAVQ
jgi:hypothetical protein